MACLRLRVLFVGLVAAFGGFATVAPARADVKPTLSVAGLTNAQDEIGQIGCPYKLVNQHTDGKVILHMSAAQAMPVVVVYTLSGDPTAWQVTPVSGAAIPAGQTTLTLVFHRKAVLGLASNVTLTIDAGAGYTVGSPAVATIMLTLVVADPPLCPQRGVSGWPHEIAAGFAASSGDGFLLAFRDGVLSGSGDFPVAGDASSTDLAAPIVGGAIAGHDAGYRLVAGDGRILSFGTRSYGSMIGTRLNRPVLSMASTKTGRGYWLVARDGGIFSFGDAWFAGSLPSIGISSADVVGMAPTPTGKGYWIARADGHVYPFGDAHKLGSYQARCDPIATIISNSHSQGYRIVTQSGATIASGSAPGGTKTTGRPSPCALAVG